MRKKVLAALLAAAVAGTTVMSGMTAFAAETEGTKAEGGNITIAETADPELRDVLRKRTLLKCNSQ